MAFLARLTSLATLIALGLTSPLAAQEGERDPDEITMEENSRTYWSGATIPQFFNDGPIKVPSRKAEDYPKNMMVEDTLSAEAKMKMMQSMMAFNPYSLRDMINMMVVKKKALDGLSFDEVVESLQLRANDLNMRAVGHNTPYIILREIDDPNSPRVEFFSFCDLITMRQIVDYSLEFIAFLPCKIAVVEDAAGDIWLVTLDWDVRWLDTSPNPNRISPELRERAISVRERIEEIMEAAANGDL